MTGDRGQVLIAHLVQRLAFGERMRLYGEVVVVGNALRRGLWIVTT